MNRQMALLWGPLSALHSKRLHVIHRKYPWATRKTSILLPSICCLHAHCNARFSNSNFFPAYPQQCPHFGQIHHGGRKTILLLLDNGVMKTPKRLFLSLIFACNTFLSQKINVASEYEGKLKRRGLNPHPFTEILLCRCKEKKDTQHDGGQLNWDFQNINRYLST